MAATLSPSSVLDTATVIKVGWLGLSESYRSRLYLFVFVVTGTSGVGVTTSGVGVTTGSEPWSGGGPP